MQGVNENEEIHQARRRFSRFCRRCAAALNGRMGLADADNDGKLSVEEIALELERMRYRRMAQRMIERFDTDGDGALTTAEVESHQKKMFALMDRNDDGKVEQGEMRRRDMRRHRR
jgi:Ca2+-binding EF-hand superfamily protein